MLLSGFMPVLVCQACGHVHAHWETASIFVGKADRNYEKVTAWWTKDFRFHDMTSSKVSPEEILSTLGPCCLKCGTEPLRIRRIMARYRLAEFWNPLTWFGDREWFLAGSGSDADVGQLSIPVDQKKGR